MGCHRANNFSSFVAINSSLSSSSASNISAPRVKLGVLELFKRKDCGGLFFFKKNKSEFLFVFAVSRCACLAGCGGSGSAAAQAGEQAGAGSRRSPRASRGRRRVGSAGSARRQRRQPARPRPAERCPRIPAAKGPRGRGSFCRLPPPPRETAEVTREYKPKGRVLL